MGTILQKLMGSGPLLQFDHSFQCCNDEIRSSSSDNSLAKVHPTKEHEKSHTEDPEGTINAVSVPTHVDAAT